MAETDVTVRKLVGTALGSTDIEEAIAALRSARRMQPSGKLPTPAYGDTSETLADVSFKDLMRAAFAAGARDSEKQRQAYLREAGARIDSDAQFHARVIP